MTKKQREQKANEAYRHYFDRVMVNMQDVGRIMDAIEAMIDDDGFDAKMWALVEAYRKERVGQ